MYLTSSQNLKAAIGYAAATGAHMGEFNSQPDAGVRAPLSVRHDLFQEVTTISIPIPIEKAAGAAAASSAHSSATTKPILPPLRCNAMGFCIFPPKITLRNPPPGNKIPASKPLTRLLIATP
jgi:hypothetical protein